MRRHLLAMVLAATLASTTLPDSPALAQSTGTRNESGRRTPRRLLFTLFGALTGAAAGATYSLIEGQSQPGTCDSPGCVLGVTIGAGALMGYIIGREADQLHELRYRGGTPLFPSEVSAPIGADAFAIAAGDSLVLVGGGGSGGVELFQTLPSQLKPVGKRAAGIRGISTLAIAPRTGVLALGASSGLYLFPPLRGPGTLVREGAVAAATTTEDRVYFATGTRVETAPLAADTARGWPGIDLAATVRDLQLGSTNGILWAITDGDLIALRLNADSIARIASTSLAKDSGAASRGPAAGRRLSVDGARAAVAAGEAGVLLFDVSDPFMPRRTASWSATRFAYDVSLVGSRLYVGGGPEGVYLLDVSGEAPVSIGLARELGFVATLLSSDGYTYLVDRRANTLRRIATNF